MSKIEYNAFIEHCKSSEIFKKIPIRIYSIHDSDLFRASGDMAKEDEDRYYGNGDSCDCDEFGCYETDYFKGDKFYIYEKTKIVKSKGYNDGKEKRWVK